MADVQIELDARATPEEIVGVRAVFDSIGKDAQVDAIWEKPPGIGNGPMWMLIAVLGIPIAAFLKSFAGKLGEEAGAAAATEFRKFIRNLQNARKASYASDGWIRLKGQKKTEVAIAASLPMRHLTRSMRLIGHVFRGGFSYGITTEGSGLPIGAPAVGDERAFTWSESSPPHLCFRARSHPTPSRARRIFGKRSDNAVS